MEDKRKSSVLKKHVATIHCSNTLSLLQRKLSNSLLYHAYPNLLKQEEHAISIKELCVLIGYNGKNDKAIKDALRCLISTVLEWNLVDDKTGQEKWTASSILASVHLEAGVCKYSYSRRLRELFHNPTVYGKINLFIQSKFTSSYGLALYENCVRYRGVPYTKEFSINTFRKIMGVPDDKYPIFRDFTRRVINKAVDEVNIHSDLFIEPEVKRLGRKPVSIKFRIKERTKKKKFGGDAFKKGDLAWESKDVPICIERMVGVYNVAPKEARKYVEKYGVKLIQEKMQEMESAESFKLGKIRSLGGFLLDSIRNNYLPVKSSTDIINITNIKKENKKQAQDNQQKLYQEFIKFQNQEIVKIYNTLVDEEKEKLLEMFGSKVSKTVYGSLFNKDGLDNALILDRFCDFVRSDGHIIINNIATFDEYIEEDK